MEIKKSLVGLLTASIIGCCSCESALSQIKTPSRTSVYENNNNSLEDKLINEVEKSVKMIEVRASYTIKTEGLPDSSESLGKRGSGTILTERGGFYYVLTAAHVVEAPEKVELSETSSAELNKLDIIVGDLKNAEIVHMNSYLDYAILRAPSDGTCSALDKNKNAKIGNSDLIETGDYVYAIGYSLGLGGRFVSDGIISNTQVPLGKTGSEYYARNDEFMFTSPINPGNNGGSIFVVDEGKLYLIGITNAKYTRGDNLYIALKIEDILKDLKNNDFNIKLK